MKVPFRRHRSEVRAFFVCLALSVAALCTACRSPHVEVAVENHTGSPIRLLEVDYPTASFGSNALAEGATFHYRIQLQGNGSLKVLYTSGEGRQIQVTGPALSEGQRGTLEIKLLPAGKAEFYPHLSGPGRP